MVRALELARLGLNSTPPNPSVGCVLVRWGQVVGEGFHHRTGEPHAEIVALHEAGGAARGATAYVTLEPCSHHGRTPPCTDALIAAGVRRLVVAMRDPNPRVDGSASRDWSGPASRPRTVCWRGRLRRSTAASCAACSAAGPG